MAELLLPGAIESLSDLPTGTINMGAPLWKGAMQIGINCEDNSEFDGFSRLIVSKSSSGLTIVTRVDDEPILAQIVHKEYDLDDTLTITRHDVFDKPVDFLELEPASTTEGRPAWLVRADNLQVSRLNRLQYFCGTVGLHALEKTQIQAAVQYAS